MTPKHQAGKINTPNADPRPQRPVETYAHPTHDQQPQDRLPQTFFTGTIVDAFPYTHQYIVTTDRSGPITAVAFEPSPGLSSQGYRPHSQYVIGTFVFCYRRPMDQLAYIIGALPPELLNPRTNLADFLQVGSPTTFMDSPGHRLPYNQHASGAFKNFNNHRPVDSFPGEWGYLNSLGMGIHLGQSHLFLKASELCGIWAFYNDHLLRMVAHRHQVWTGAYESESANDDGESSTVHRSNSYPWELHGVRNFQDPMHRQTLGGWRPGSTDALFEPKHPDQTGIFRRHVYEGYLGDAYREIISCPPQAEPSEPERLSDRTKHIGLLDIQHQSNGAFAMRSAHSITIEKYLVIPVPKKLREIDDPDGDQTNGTLAGGYKFAGEVSGFVTGGVVPVHDQTPLELGSTESGCVFAQLDDMHAWLFNSHAQAGLHYHKRDWYVPQESEMVEVGSAYSDSAFASLGMRWAASLPEFVDLKVDHREGATCRYYRTRAGLDILPDGSVAITDGYGSQLRMGGGNIELTCQGDARLMTGRSVVIMAPRDFIARAGNCIEATASLGDVRLKAEKNLHMLAGNSGSGAVMIESRSSGTGQKYAGKVGTDVSSSGVMIVTKGSPVTIYGKDIYMRSLDASNICLDADQGKGDILTFSNTHYTTVRDTQTVVFGGGPADGGGGTYEVHTASSVIFGQGSSVNFACSSLTVQGSIWSGKSINAKRGFNQAPCRRGIGCIGFGGLGGIAAAIAGVAGTLSSISGGMKGLYGSSGMGSASQIKSFGFTLRSDTQYGVESMSLYEATWQRAFRRKGSGTKKWQEKRVAAPDGGQATMPYPGLENWTSKPTYRLTDPTLFDDLSGYNRDRRYEKAKAQAPTQTVPSNSYLINTQS